MEVIEKIEEYTNEMDFESFVNNKLVEDAVIKNFIVIGEAVKCIPKEIKEKYQILIGEVLQDLEMLLSILILK
jgi:uncharacterized protein with HEPN domain